MFKKKRQAGLTYLVRVWVVEGMDVDGGDEVGGGVLVENHPAIGTAADKHTARPVYVTPHVPPTNLHTWVWFECSEGA